MEKENTSNRIKKIMADRGLKQVDIIKLCEPICKKYNDEYNLDIQIKKNDLSQWISGLYNPGHRKLAILAEALDVSPVWLMGYDVSMDDKLVVVVDDDIGNFKKGQFLRKKEEIEEYSNLLESSIEKYKKKIEAVKNLINESFPKLEFQLNQALIANEITVEQYNNEIKRFLWILKILDGMTQKEFDNFIKKYLK